MKYIYNLACEIAELAYDYDTYDFKDNYTDYEEATEQVYELLNNKDFIVLDWLDKLLEYSRDDNELETRILALRGLVCSLYES